MLLRVLFFFLESEGGVLGRHTLSIREDAGQWRTGLPDPRRDRRHGSAAGVRSDLPTPASPTDAARDCVMALGHL